MVLGLSTNVSPDCTSTVLLSLGEVALPMTQNLVDGVMPSAPDCRVQSSPFLRAERYKDAGVVFGDVVDACRSKEIGENR